MWYCIKNRQQRDVLTFGSKKPVRNRISPPLLIMIYFVTRVASERLKYNIDSKNRIE